MLGIRHSAGAIRIQELLHVERRTTELHAEPSISRRDDRVLGPRIERLLVQRLLVLPHTAGAADRNPELAADAPHPLQMHVAARDHVGLTERLAEAIGRYVREDDVLVRRRR